MANRFRDFGRMLSTARKEGFGSRTFSSKAGKKSPKIQKDAAPIDDRFNQRKKELYGGIDYRSLTYAERMEIITRRANRKADIEALKTVFITAAIGLPMYSYLAYGWYPFKKGDSVGLYEQEKPRSSSPTQRS